MILKGKTKKVLALIITFVILASSATVFYVYAVPTDSAGKVFDSMLQRAEAIVNYEWVPSQRIDVWNENPYNGKMYFEAGETVVGMPYTLFTSEFGVDSLMSLEQYKKVASSNYSATTICKSVRGEPERTGPVYGSCCATFVSEVFGGKFMLGSDPRYDGIGGIQSSPYGTTITNVKLNDIKLGDALSESEGSHIIWVGGITDETITIYEQTPPVARKVTVSKSSVTSDGYLIYNYKDNGEPYIYNVVTRSDELLEEECDYELSDKYSTPIQAYTINTGKTLVYKTIDGEAKVNKIYDTDLCVINKLYANGWCYVKFPLDAGGYETGYVKTSVFFDFDAEKNELLVSDQTKTYSRSNLADNIGYVGAGDTVYVSSQTDDAIQVIYPLITGGYKVGWISKNSVICKLTYDANGGENSPATQNATFGEGVAISSTVPSKNGYSFIGWAKEKDSFSATYYPGDIVTMLSDTVLYAVWRRDSSSEVLPGDVNGDGAVNDTDIVVLREYLVNYDEVNGESTISVSAGADVNNDGAVNGKDLIRLRKLYEKG